MAFLAWIRKRKGDAGVNSAHSAPLRAHGNAGVHARSTSSGSGSGSVAGRASIDSTDSSSDECGP